MLGNKIFAFFKNAVKFTVLISVILFLVSKPASSNSLSAQADYYAQPQSAFSKVLDRLGAFAGRVIFGVDVSSPVSIVKGSFPDAELSLWAPEEDIIFGGDEISDSLKMEVEEITEGLKLEPLDLKDDRSNIKILIRFRENKFDDLLKTENHAELEKLNDQLEAIGHHIQLIKEEARAEKENTKEMVSDISHQLKKIGRAHV